MVRFISFMLSYGLYSTALLALLWYAAATYFELNMTPLH